MNRLTTLLCFAFYLSQLPAAQPTAASDLFEVGQLSLLAGGHLGEGMPSLTTSLQPQDMALAPDGRLYIADEQHNRIRVVDTDGRISTLVGSGRIGHNGDGLPGLETDLWVPASLEFGPDGRLYFVDLGNRQLRVVEADGTISTVLTEAPFIRAGHPKFLPASLTLDRNGLVYLADRGNHTVWQIDIQRGARSVAGNGQRGFSGDGRPSALAQIADPRAVAVASDGGIYVADLGNRRVRYVDTQGIIHTLAGNGKEDAWDQPLPALEASIKPLDIAVDLEDRLLIIDGLQARVLRLEHDGTLHILATFPAADEPNALHLGPNGEILVSTYQGRQIFQLEPGGTLVPIAGNGRIRASGDGGPATEASFFTPLDLLRTDTGALYIADHNNHLVRYISPEGTIETVAGTGTPGFSGDHGLATLAQLNRPAGLAMDLQGNLYIADRDNHLIRRVSPDGLIETVAGAGTPGFSGDHGLATLAQLDKPAGLTFDPAGRLLIGDSGNGRIRRLELDGTLQTIAGNGLTDLSATGGPALQTALRSPQSLAPAPDGGVWILDADAHRLYHLTPEGLLRPLAGNGQAAPAQSGSQAVNAPLNYPVDIVSDGAHGLFISERRRLLHLDGDGVLRPVLEVPGNPAGLAVDSGTLIFSDVLGHCIKTLQLERLLEPPAYRIDAPGPYQIKTLAALPLPDLLEILYSPFDDRLYVTHPQSIDQLLPTGERILYAQYGHGTYHTAATPEGLWAGTAAFLNYNQPLTKLAPLTKDSIGYFPQPWFLDGVEAIASNVQGFLFVSQANGPLVRLNIATGESNDYLPLEQGPTLLAATPKGVLYVAYSQTGELFKAEDLNGDGRITGSFELSRFAHLQTPLSALEWNDGLYAATTRGQIYQFNNQGDATLFAAGFAPTIIDMSWGPQGTLYVLEGDRHNGRIILMKPPHAALEYWPTEINFGPQLLGEATNQDLFLRNDGPTPLVLSGQLDASNLGSMRLIPDGPIELAPGAVRQIQLVAQPDQRGLASASLDWLDQHTGAVIASQPIAIDALAPRLELNTQSIDFGAVPLATAAATASQPSFLLDIFPK